MPFVSRNTLKIMEKASESLRALAESQKQLLDHSALARDAAIRGQADAEKRANDLEARLNRLRDLLRMLGIECAGHEEGSALWPSYAPRLLSVRLAEEPEDVADLLPDTPLGIQEQVLLSARQLIRTQVP